MRQDPKLCRKMHVYDRYALEDIILRESSLACNIVSFFDYLRHLSKSKGRKQSSSLRYEPSWLWVSLSKMDQTREANHNNPSSNSRHSIPHPILHPLLMLMRVLRYWLINLLPRHIPRHLPTPSPSERLDPHRRVSCLLQRFDPSPSNILR